MDYEYLAVPMRNVTNVLHMVKSVKPEVHIQFIPQIREQMSGPDLHLLTLKFLAIKKLDYPLKKYFPKLF